MTNRSARYAERIARLSVATALCLILSYIEFLLPLPVPVPGIKIGLANVLILFALYRCSVPEAAAVAFVRVFLANLLFGSWMGMLFSAAGALLSFAVMLLLKRIPHVTPTGASVAGGVFHNIGQVIVAALVMQGPALLAYLPFLLVSGTVSGIVVGILAALLIQKSPYPGKPAVADNTEAKETPNDDTEHQ